MKHNLIKAVAATTMLILTAGSLLAGPYDGKYRYNPTWNCRDIGSDGGAIQISGNVFEGIESRCELKNPVPVRGLKATLFDMDCTGEGETYGYRALFMIQGDGNLLIVSEGFSNVWERCP